MSLKRKIALTGGLLLLLSVLLACLLTGAYFYLPLLTGAYFYLPFYVESKIIPKLAADAGSSLVHSTSQRFS